MALSISSSSRALPIFTAGSVWVCGDKRNAERLQGVGGFSFAFSQQAIAVIDDVHEQRVVACRCKPALERDP